MRIISKNNILNSLKLLTLLLTLASTNLLAQNQNGMAFDGIDDITSSPNASALISGSDELSISCWVYPSNPNPSGSYDGIVGFRNNVDGDFYMLHFTSNTIEARFRNSTGTYFDVIGTGIVVNTWQHLTFTYDGNWLRYYRNAVCTDSTAATGNITVNTDAFYMGGLIDVAGTFNFVGKIDEVTLWNKALTPSDLTCIYNGQADTTDINLLLYYKFNQGVAGGNNTSITSLVDSKGNIDATLSGLSMTGSTSNFVAGTTGGSINTPQSAGICQGDTFYFGNQALTFAGIYYQTFTSSAGCDSTVELSLNVSSVNATATQNGTTLVATPSFAVYQWFNCATNTAFPGATNVSYNTQGLNGSYGVVVTQNGCTDTSNCIAITTGLENNEFSNSIDVYPNPMNNFLNVDLNKNYSNVTVSITDIAGKEMLRSNFEHVDAIKADVSVLSKGVYFVHLTADDKTAVLKLMKN